MRIILIWNESNLNIKELEMNNDIIISVEDALQQTGIDTEELAAELEYFADSLLKLAQRYKADKNGDLNITDIDRFSLDLCCGDFGDELFVLQTKARKVLAPFNNQLLENYLASTEHTEEGVE